MRKILAIGDDAALLRTRQLVLEHAQAVVQAASPVAALALLRNTSFDLLVLCQTVNPAQAEALLQVARLSHPPAKVLLLSASQLLSPKGTLEERFDSREGPAALVRRVESMLLAELAELASPPEQPRRRAAGTLPGTLTGAPGSSILTASSTLTPPRRSGSKSSGRQAGGS